jgi:hypothetical protein
MAGAENVGQVSGNGSDSPGGTGSRVIVEQGIFLAPVSRRRPHLVERTARRGAENVVRVPAILVTAHLEPGVAS